MRILEISGQALSANASLSSDRETFNCAIGVKRIIEHEKIEVKLITSTKPSRLWRGLVNTQHLREYSPSHSNMFQSQSLDIQSQN